MGACLFLGYYYLPRKLLVEFIIYLRNVLSVRLSIYLGNMLPVRAAGRVCRRLYGMRARATMQYLYGK
jgi:hypothetical protein